MTSWHGTSVSGAPDPATRSPRMCLGRADSQTVWTAQRCWPALTVQNGHEPKAPDDLCRRGWLALEAVHGLHCCGLVGLGLELEFHGAMTLLPAFVESASATNLFAERKTAFRLDKTAVSSRYLLCKSLFKTAAERRNLLIYIGKLRISFCIHSASRQIGCPREPVLQIRPLRLSLVSKFPILSSFCSGVRASLSLFSKSLLISARVACPKFCR